MVTSTLWVPDRRDMIWIGFNPRAGHEMRDGHPMLVLSTKAFNGHTGMVIGLPMTPSASNETNTFAVKHVGPKREAGYVLTYQPKSFDWRAGGARPRPWKQVSPTVFAEACTNGLSTTARPACSSGSSPPRRPSAPTCGQQPDSRHRITNADIVPERSAATRSASRLTRKAIAYNRRVITLASRQRYREK
jgi:mRNA interferase MazF